MPGLRSCTLVSLLVLLVIFAPELVSASTGATEQCQTPGTDGRCPDPVVLDFDEANFRMKRDRARGKPCDSFVWLDLACADASTVETCPEVIRFNYALLLQLANRREDYIHQLELLTTRFENANIDIQRNVLLQLAQARLQTGKVKEARQQVKNWLGNEKRMYGKAMYVVSEKWFGNALLSLFFTHVGHEKPKKSKFFDQNLAVLARVTKRIKNKYAGWGAKPDETSVTKLRKVPDAAEFQQFVEARQPVLLSLPGGLAGLGLQKVPPELLVKRAGGTIVSVEASRSGGQLTGLYGVPNQSTRHIICPLTHVLSDIFGGNGTGTCVGWISGGLPICPTDTDTIEENAPWELYLNTQTDGLFSAPSDSRPFTSPAHLVKDELRPPEFLQSRVQFVNLWVGSGSGRSMLHSDGSENLYVMHRGRKKITLWPPSEIEAARVSFAVKQINPSGLVEFYNPSDARGSNSLQSLFLRTDGATHEQQGLPLRAEAAAFRARGVTVEIKGGEALYIPARWFHEVESSEETGTTGHMAVNYWFATPADIDERTLQWRAGQ